MNSNPSALAMLQQDREPLLPDNGFSQRVVRDLPRHSRQAAWRRWTSAAALAVGIAATARWAPLPGGASLPVSVIFAGLLAVTSGCVLWAYVAGAFEGSPDE